MALYRTSLRLATDMPGIPARKWSNAFVVDTASAAAAAAAFVALWIDILRGAARERVYAYEVYASSLAEGDTDFVTQPIPSGNQRGALLTPSSTQPYLPKACVSVDLLVPGSRPSRKFWRPGLYESDIENGVSIVSTIDDAIRDNFELMLSVAPWLVDVDGEEIDSIGQLRLTTRNFGREATNLVPSPPPFG